MSYEKSPLKAASAIRWVVSTLVLAALSVGVVLVVNRSGAHSSAAPVTTASPLSPQTITKGDLVKTSKADGTLEYADTFTVWHRIEGQKATASSSAATTGNSARGGTAGNTSLGGSTNQGPSGGAPRTAHVALSDRPAESTPPSTTSCAPTSSTTTPASSPSTLAPSTVDPCTSGGGRGGGGAARPGGGAVSGSGATAQAARITQIVTSITSVGRAVGNGDVLYTIDSVPVIALLGALPEWRTLDDSATDGSDIKQLEQALVDLGYDPDGTVTVDEVFDANTTAMVKRWQTGLGRTATGKVSLGSVVFIPKAATVSTVSRKVGDSVGDADEMLTLSGKSQRVLIDVPAGDEQYWVPGLTVNVGGTTGRLIVLQSVSRNSTAVVQAMIVPDTLIDGAENGATVTVTAELLIASNVFVIPSQALVSRVDGTYAVQVVGADGTARWQAVTLKGVAGLRAGVVAAGSADSNSTDGLADGASVLAPSA